jgi:hypothetical protein
MPTKQQPKISYNLFTMRHELKNKNTPTAQERLAIEILNYWYDGLASEVTTVNKLVKIGVLNYE